MTISLIYIIPAKRNHTCGGQSFLDTSDKHICNHRQKLGRVVHTNLAKLRLLYKKVKADFLENSKAVIKLELSRVPITITYDHALAYFHNAVNWNFPVEQSTQRTCCIQKVTMDGQDENQRTK